MFTPVPSSYRQLDLANTTSTSTHQMSKGPSCMSYSSITLLYNVPCCCLLDKNGKRQVLGSLEHMLVSNFIYNKEKDLEGPISQNISPFVVSCLFYMAGEELQQLQSYRNWSISKLPQFHVLSNQTTFCLGFWHFQINNVIIATIFFFHFSVSAGSALVWWRCSYSTDQLFYELCAVWTTRDK